MEELKRKLEELSIKTRWIGFPSKNPKENKSKFI